MCNVFHNFLLQSELDAIPFVERSLSRSLRDIRVVKRQNQPITLVTDYRSRLRKLMTSVGDFRLDTLNHIYTEGCKCI